MPRIAEAPDQALLPGEVPEKTVPPQVESHRADGFLEWDLLGVPVYGPDVTLVVAHDD